MTLMKPNSQIACKQNSLNPVLMNMDKTADFGDQTKGILFTAKDAKERQDFNPKNSENFVQGQNQNHENNDSYKRVCKDRFSRRFGFALHRIFTVFHAFKSSYKSCSSLLKTVFLKSAIVLGRRRKPINLSSPPPPLFVSISGSAFSSLARPSSSFTLELLW